MLTLADRYRGRWHVIYPDGQRSIGMKLSVALDYRALFGGSIEGKLFGYVFKI